MVPAYASMMTYATPEDVAAAAVGAVEAGYKSVKLHEVEIERVKATREAVGDDIEITMDPTGYFNPLEAERFARALAGYDVGWLEEPIWPPDDYQAMAQNRNVPYSSTQFSIRPCPCSKRPSEPLVFQCDYP